MVEVEAEDNEGEEEVECHYHEAKCFLLVNKIPTRPGQRQESPGNVPVHQPLALGLVHRSSLGETKRLSEHWIKE